MDVRDQQEHSSGNVAWLVGRIFFIPFRTLLYGMEMIVQAMRAFQRAGDLGMHVIAGADPGSDGLPTRSTVPAGAGTVSFGSDAIHGSDSNQTHSQEKTSMDKNLNDDMLKLVRYKVLFVRRGYEHAFPEREALVWDNMDGAAFTAWKIAEFIQMLGRRDTAVPHAWSNYPPADPKGKTFRDGEVLLGFPEEDKKYLRVFYEVLERYPREKLRYEEQHLEVLKEIRDRIPQS
jgi:hypothetical protein